VGVRADVLNAPLPHHSAGVASRRRDPRGTTRTEEVNESDRQQGGEGRRAKKKRGGQRGTCLHEDCCGSVRAKGTRMRKNKDKPEKGLGVKNK